MTSPRVSRQHLVSQTLLKQFTLQGPRGSGRRLLPVDVVHPERSNKLKSTRACGSVRDFITFDPCSSEKLWGAVEQDVPAALAAVAAGDPFTDPAHGDTLRDLVALHYVRSHRYHKTYFTSFEKVCGDLRHNVVRHHPDRLRSEAQRQTGLHLVGTGGLDAFAQRMIEQSETMQIFTSGELFRSSIESMFNKVRERTRSRNIEVLTPASGQFLIGDNPAVAVRFDTGSFTHGMAFDDAQSVVLPVGPRHLLALGPANTVSSIPKSYVDLMNSVQVLAAHRYVYLHPRSNLEEFARRVARKRGSSGEARTAARGRLP